MIYGRSLVRSNKYLPENVDNLSLFDDYKNKVIKASSKVYTDCFNLHFLSASQICKGCIEIKRNSQKTIGKT